MWSYVIVLSEPLVDDDLSLLSRGEPLGIENLPSQSRLGHRLRARQALQRSELQDADRSRRVHAPESLAVTVLTWMTTDDEFEALYSLLLRHGTIEYIRSDNGPGFVAQAMQDWLEASNLIGYIPVHLGRTDTKTAPPAHFSARYLMPNGTLIQNRPRSPSTNGSGSTAISDHIRP